MTKIVEHSPSNIRQNNLNEMDETKLTRHKTETQNKQTQNQ